MDSPTTCAGSTPRRGRRDLAALAGALVIATAASAQTAGGPKLLPADQAFKLSARTLDAKTVEVRFNVADGYYLYRDKLRFKVEPPPTTAGAPALPPGKPHKDEFFGEVVIYRGLMVAKLPIQGAKAGQPVTLVADSQGCADAGVCYPPQTQRVELKVPAAGAGPSSAVEATPAKKDYFK
ncbi:MAG TPA: protein-disulfide reductase DsbD domain-containing protein [Casimicrobiaceae bacterium]|jgi:thiol:disulfide interchange protein DsbD